MECKEKMRREREKTKKGRREGRNGKRGRRRLLELVNADGNSSHGNE